MADTIDDNWLQEFEKQEEIYKDFYKEQLENIRLFMLYVDKQNHISIIKRSTATLDNGILKKENLIAVLKEYMNHDNKRYRPISLLKYNIDISPLEVNSYLKNSKDYDFLAIEKNINDIDFNDSITLFHDINSLYIIFHESWNSFHNRTKKIYIKKKLKKGRRKTKRA